MKSLAITLALALSACAPTYRLVTKKCPPTASVVGDVLIATGLYVASAATFYFGNTERSMALLAGGTAVALGANIAETTCR